MFSIQTKGVGELRAVARRFQGAEMDLATAMAVEGQVAASQTEDKLSDMFPDESIHWSIDFEIDPTSVNIAVNSIDDYGSYTIDLYSDEINEIVLSEIEDFRERLLASISGVSGA
jgi:hypothetical protein